MWKNPTESMQSLRKTGSAMQRKTHSTAVLFCGKWWRRSKVGRGMVLSQARPDSSKYLLAMSRGEGPKGGKFSLSELDSRGQLASHVAAASAGWDVVTK